MIQTYKNFVNLPPQKVGGYFTFYEWSKHPDEGGVIVRQFDFPNSFTVEGLTYLLATGLAGTLYMGLINNSPTPSLSSADTAASHGGWAECVDYGASTRVAWTKNSAASAAITTQTVSTFTMNATVTLYGAFISTSSTKSGTGGSLICTGAFGSTQAMVNGRVFSAGYTLTLTAA